jgi:hypothetical protein
MSAFSGSESFDIAMAIESVGKPPLEQRPSLQIETRLWSEAPTCIDFTRYSRACDVGSVRGQGWRQLRLLQLAVDPPKMHSLGPKKLHESSDNGWTCWLDPKTVKTLCVTAVQYQTRLITPDSMQH